MTNIRRCLQVAPILAVSLVGCGETASAPEDPVASVVVAPAQTDMAIGDTLRMTAVARSDRGSTLAGRSFVWTSDRPAAATVDDAGLVTARGGGRATIRAATEGRSGSSVVDVAPAAPPEISAMSPSTIQAGWDDFTLLVEGVNITPDARITWEGQLLESFSVGPTEIQGTVPSSYVTSEGSAEVRVETAGPDGHRSNALVFTVFARPAVTVDLLISGNATSVGDRIALRALARDQFGAVIEGKRITWTSSDTTIAKVEGGFLRGLRVGTVDLVADAYPTSRGALFTIVEPPVAEVGFETRPVGAFPELFRRSLDPPGGVGRLFPAITFGRQMAVSPDGARIVFVGDSEGSNLDIYLAQVDGGGLTRLTTDPAVDDQPTWSRDGTRIAFRSFRDGKSDILVMNADGSSQLNLTYADAFLPEEYNADPAWSPDGESLVFSRGFGLGQDLYKVGRDGSALTPFLHRAGSDLVEPAWSEDDLMAVRRIDRTRGEGGIDFVSGTTGDPVDTFWPLPASARTPLFVGNGWVVVSALGHPDSTLPTIAFYHLTMGYVVVPVGPEFGRLEEPSVLRR